MLKKINSSISDRIKQIPTSAIHEMTRLSKQFEDVAFLSWAKPTSGTPSHINEAAIDAIKNGLVGGYSQNTGLIELRELIAKKLNRDNNIKANPTEIVVTIGAVEGLSSAVMTTINPGEEVIFPSPTYSTHVNQVILANGKPIFVPLIEEENFSWDIDSLRKAINSKTKAIMYCSPSNPTGTVFNEKQLREIAQVSLENNLMVITDEAYEYFTFDGAKHFSIGSIPEMKSNVISCYTFTKTYAMTGWRVGYLHADTEIIPHISKAHIPFAICAPVISQYAAIAALAGPQDCVNEFKQKYLSARNLMCKRLDELSNFFDYQKPGGSYLMFPRIKHKDGKDSLTFCKKLLLDAKVSTTPGIAFGPTGEGHMRLSFCVPEETIDKAFDRIQNYLK